LLHTRHTTHPQLRSYRKDIADLLRAGKLDYAIIRVESVIREQLTLTGGVLGGGVLQLAEQAARDARLLLCCAVCGVCRVLRRLPVSCVCPALRAGTSAFEILELFLELVAVRTAMIAQSKTIPGDMMEVVSLCAARGLHDCEGWRCALNPRLHLHISTHPPPPPPPTGGVERAVRERTLPRAGGARQAACAV
jgi:hypothetical protein